MQTNRTDERSLGDLFSDLSRETTTLVRQEIKLATTEMSQKATRAGKDVGFLVAGGAVVYAGALAIIAAIILVLGQAGVPWWLSAAIVGVVVAGIGAILIWRGLDNLKHEDMTPRQTIDTIKGDIDAIKGA